jgi:hypothetical protein
VVFVLGEGGKATEGHRKALGAMEECLGSISSREESILTVILESVKPLGGDGFVTSSGVLRVSSAIEEDDEWVENDPENIDGASIIAAESSKNLFEVV